jgi:phage terminase large subunit-like protein
VQTLEPNTVSQHQPGPARGISLAEKIAKLPPHLREYVLEGISEAEFEAIGADWNFWARPEQLPPPGNWTTWLILAGRGFGKTRSGAEWVRSKVERGDAGRIALVGRSAADVRDIQVEGESGLIATASPHFRPKYLSSKRRVEWPNGAYALMFSSEEPDGLRGLQHDLAWSDELASWKYIDDTWSNLQLGLRLGANPQNLVSTTPKPVKRIRLLVNRAKLVGSNIVVTKGSSYANRANLSPAFFEEIVSEYEGTRLGQQELYAEILDDVPGALWRRWMFEPGRRIRPMDLRRVVVAIDPAVSTGEGSAQTGIIVVGEDTLQRYFALADRTLRGTPNEWANAAIDAYHEFEADRVIGEVNNGGDMVEAVVKNIDENIPFKSVRATRGKMLRAEPIATLYEKGRGFHPYPLVDLEDQLCNWEHGSDILVDRLDALVWGMTYLTQYGRVRKIKAA